MKITPHQVRFLEQVASYGIYFASGHWALGNFELKPDQIEAFSNDPDQFAAEQLGVSKNLFDAWAKFQHGQQCLGLTKKKERCRERAGNGHKVFHPKFFSITNPDCYCGKHKPK